MWPKTLLSDKITQGDGWLSYALLATAALWVRIQTSLKKYKVGDISKGVANTLYSAKKYKKDKITHE
jgi:hypothetical protein